MQRLTAPSGDDGSNVGTNLYGICVIQGILIYGETFSGFIVCCAVIQNLICKISSVKCKKK